MHARKEPSYTHKGVILGFILNDYNNLKQFLVELHDLAFDMFPCHSCRSSPGPPLSERRGRLDATFADKIFETTEVKPHDEVK